MVVYETRQPYFFRLCPPLRSVRTVNYTYEMSRRLLMWSTGFNTRGALVGFVLNQVGIIRVQSCVA